MLGPFTGPRTLPLLVAEMATPPVWPLKGTEEWKMPGDEAVNVTGAALPIRTLTLAVPAVKTVKKMASTSHWPGG
jgi:hypothetical protein